MLYDFIKLPRWVMEIPFLDLTECVVLSVLLSAENTYADKNGDFFLKYEEIAEMSKLSLSQTKRVIKKLEGYNLITTVRRKRMHYRLEWDRLNSYKNKQTPTSTEEVKPVETEDMKKITIDTHKEETIIEVPTPDDDRYEFSCWVNTQAQEHIPRWIALVRNKKTMIALDEIVKFANSLSVKYYDGGYQKDMREVLGRRIRNAS